MITKEKFQAYEKVRVGGKTNMFNVPEVVRLSKNKLTRDECIEIMSHYALLTEQYPGVRK